MKSKSSHRWLKEHFDDPYVKRAQKEGYRSRAIYKLQEIQQRDHLLKQGMTVVDLGAAPGGWSQLVKQLVGHKGRIIALDILPMDSLAGVEFIQGDFTEPTVLNQLLQLLDKQPVDLVISDMAPNMSGTREVDQPRAMYLVELAWDFAQQMLKPRGDFLVKVFQGEGSEEFLRSLRPHFEKVAIRKPKASRGRSNEVYVLGRGFKKAIS